MWLKETFVLSPEATGGRNEQNNSAHLNYQQENKSLLKKTALH